MVIAIIFLLLFFPYYIYIFYSCNVRFSHAGHAFFLLEKAVKQDKCNLHTHVKVLWACNCKLADQYTLLGTRGVLHVTDYSLTWFKAIKTGREILTEHVEVISYRLHPG